LAGDAVSDADADTEADTAGWVKPGTGVSTLVPPGAGPEPEKVPVLAASATPPVAPTAINAARTLTVSSWRAGLDHLLSPGIAMDAR